MNLKITSFNCQSFNCNVEIVSDLMKECDFLLLQETFLSDNCIDELSVLGHNYSYFAEAATRNAHSFRGRASGGLAIIFKKEFVPFVEFFHYSSRIMGLYLKFDGITYLLVNVYLPCDYGTTDSFTEYMLYLAELSNIFNLDNINSWGF